MILFPYAKDIDYKDNTLNMTLQFFTDSLNTEVSMQITLDDDISSIIEGLLIKEEI